MLNDEHFMKADSKIESISYLYGNQIEKKGKPFIQIIVTFVNTIEMLNVKYL